ncbi:redoxin domain-containing protein [Streptomyces sp. b62]|uniref:redoxin domain-containing protein n=1 Tax=Streptomyces sp. b62 TaxID=1827627 RepID=UPI00211D8CA7|nr:redoxin domain-containing protein [Streptomyces sp. b62]
MPDDRSRAGPGPRRDGGDPAVPARLHLRCAEEDRGQRRRAAAVVRSLRQLQQGALPLRGRCRRTPLLREGPGAGGHRLLVQHPRRPARGSESLRGKVTLVDFWTYSCINCQRAVPHLRDWERAYRDAGLRIIGVHSPEFAFEKKRSNVVAGAEKLGVDWPVALDNDLTTWDNYRNRFWPAKYLIDAEGTVRYFKFGEGEYDKTEKMIRELLRQADPTVTLPEPTGRAMDDLAADRTPETYLSNLRIRGYVGTPLVDDRPTAYRFPKGSLPVNKLSLDGTWTAGYEQFTAGKDAKLAFTYRAKNANLVLAGTGKVTVLVNGEATKTISVTGSPTLYRLTDDKDARTARLELRVDEGIQAYVFTFG